MLFWTCSECNEIEVTTDNVPYLLHRHAIDSSFRQSSYVLFHLLCHRTEKEAKLRAKSRPHKGKQHTTKEK